MAGPWGFLNDAPTAVVAAWLGAAAITALAFSRPLSGARISRAASALGI
jgi:hypothetical protein